MKYQAIIYDIDGTLLDTSEGVVDTYRYIIGVLGLKQMNDAELVRLNGPVSQVVFSEYFHLQGEHIQHATDLYRKYYLKHNVYKAKLYDGIKELLEIVRSCGVSQAVATNKRQDIAEAVCDHFGISPYLCPIIGQDNVPTRTKMDIINECLLKLGTRCAVMVGDTGSDKQAAKEAGIDFIGVNYGYGFQNVPGYVNSPKEILDRIGSDNV